MDEESNKRLGELIDELAKGNTLALAEIAPLIQPALKSIGSYYYKNNADIEDSIHDLYIKLKKKASCFQHKSNPKAWIIAMYRNLVKSQLRYNQREREYIEREIAHFKVNTNIMDDRYMENHLFVREIFSKLTEEERQIIIYYYWCQCSVRDVAAILHKPSSTIHNKLKNLEEKIKKF